MAAKFVLRQDGQSRFLILFQTHSGQVLLTSEVHRHKDIALSRISATRTLAKNTKNYEQHTEAEGSSYFMIKNARGRGTRPQQHVSRPNEHAPGDQAGQDERPGSPARRPDCSPETCEASRAVGHWKMTVTFAKDPRSEAEWGDMTVIW